MVDQLGKKVIGATKWTVLTEVVVKLIHPVTNMILARLLTPEAFGVVTTLAMITSLAGILTDAGFHKYLIQHEFKDGNDLRQSTDVAFWSNLLLSLIIWTVIACLADSLAVIVGCPGLGHVLIISSIPIVLGAFSSIQVALYKRHFEFRILFRTRLASVILPFIVTVPLAFMLRSYWALVIGGIVQGVVNAALLTFYSSWKPHFYYSLKRLREMLSFSAWSVFESFSIWLTGYLDVFIVGTALSSYYLGVYRTSTVTVMQITGLITAATTPVLFSVLSRLQDNDEQFRKLFSLFQKCVGILVIPASVGIFCFSDLITAILLGDQWTEASGFIGLWGLTSGITIVLSHYSSEVFRAKGRPQLSVLSQWLDIIVLLPVVMIAVRYDFQTLYIARSFVRLEGVVVSLAILYLAMDFSPWKMVGNIVPSILASIPMALVACYLRSISHNMMYQFLVIIICSAVYFAVLFLFRSERQIIARDLLRRLVACS